MNHTILYIHGQGGGPGEAEQYAPLFPACDVKGFPYRARTPWEAAEEFPKLFDALCGKSPSVTVIANSIGAWFAMSALSDRPIEKACFISPIVDMEKLIADRMARAGVSEAALREKGEIEIPSGQPLSWEYLRYVREHPIRWTVPTRILYGGRDDLTSPAAVAAFAEKTGAALTVMEDGEHWFHTEEQMRFLYRWLKTVG